MSVTVRCEGCGATTEALTPSTVVTHASCPAKVRGKNLPVYRPVEGETDAK